MSTQTLAATRPITSTVVAVSAPFPLVSGPKAASRRRVAMTLLAGGVLALGLAAFGLTAITSTPASVVTPEEVPSPVALTLAGPEAVSVVTQVYDPGQDSGWHSHPGIHAVAVLSGTLTMYDANCGRQTFAAGRPYVGGQELHLARNEAAEPVEMVVTYLAPATAADSTRHVAAPACWGRSDG